MSFTGVIDGGDAFTTDADIIDGGDAYTVFTDVLDGGDAFSYTAIRRPVTVAGRPEFRMELLDSNNEPIGELHPETGVQVKIATGATIGRTLTGVVLRGDDVDTFDPHTHRLRPLMIQGSTVTELGIFLPTITAVHRTSLGDVLDVAGHDQGFLLSQTLQYAFGGAQGDTITDLIADLAVLAGVVVAEITQVPNTLGTYLAWPPGQRVIDAMAALCRIAGLTNPWFDREGNLRIQPLPYVGADAPRVEWGPGQASVVSDGATEVDDIWNIANEWLAISKSDNANLGGRYRLPSSHPRSQESGAPPLVRTFDVPGLATTAQCRDRARDEAQRDAKVHASVSLSVRTDPLVDQYDVIRYRDQDWLLTDATIPLTVGADMSVTLRESLVSGEGN